MSTAQCSAIANALKANGYTNTQLASKVGLGTQRIDDILSGKVKPSQQEFNSIATALNLSNAPGHAAQITA